MIPVAIAAIKVMRHALLLHSQVVFTECLRLYNTRHSVCDLYAQSSQLLYLPRIVRLQNILKFEFGV